MTFAENLAAAAKTATCSWFNTGGNAAVSTVLVNGVITTGINPVTVGTGLGLLALSYGCSYDPSTGPVDDRAWTGCKKSSNGLLRVGTIDRRDNSFHWSWLNVTSINAIRYDGLRPGYTDEYLYYHDLTTNYGNSTVKGSFNYKDYLRPYSEPMPGGTCIESETGQPPPNPDLPDVIHTVDEGCDIQVEHLAWNLLPDGRIAPVLKMTGKPKARASGGVVGGCNWGPLVYVGPPGGGGGGGGGGIFPWQDLPNLPNGDPWWAEFVDNVLGGAVEAALDKIFETKFQPDTYRLVSVCETDEQGEPVSQERRVDIPALPGFEAVVARVDALTQLIQGLKDFKQPICRTRPDLMGDWVTVGFMSDEPSPAGERPLRKLFRYRDQTSASQDDHVTHWKDFTWQAGPVMVVHRGASWGTPQVWAQTPAEGKRVIRHAAAIAGVDTEAPGTSWLVSGASDPRYGQTGTMRVSHRGGVLHVSKRPTPSGRPLVPAVTVDP